MQALSRRLDGSGRHVAVEVDLDRDVVCVEVITSAHCRFAPSIRRAGKRPIGRPNGAVAQSATISGPEEGPNDARGSFALRHQKTRILRAVVLYAIVVGVFAASLRRHKQFGISREAHEAISAGLVATERDVNARNELAENLQSPLTRGFGERVDRDAPRRGLAKRLCVGVHVRTPDGSPTDWTPQSGSRPGSRRP